MLGEMGLAYPDVIKSNVPAIAAFLNHKEPLLRERAVNALGRIGRDCFESIQAYWPNLFRFAEDDSPGVRLAFIWAPEIFRVLGKRRADFVAPHLDELRHIAETDTNRVVRIHCQGAAKTSISSSTDSCGMGHFNSSLSILPLLGNNKAIGLLCFKLTITIFVQSKELVVSAFTLYTIFP